jgi:hypothetical protein
MKSFLEYINEDINCRNNNDFFRNDTIEFEENPIEETSIDDNPPIDNSMNTSGSGIDFLLNPDNNLTLGKGTPSINLNDYKWDSNLNKSVKINNEEPNNESETNNKILILDAIVPSTLEEDRSGVNDTLNAKFKDSVIIKLYQLNISTHNGNEEPIDGMVQVYNNLENVDGIVIISDSKSNITLNLLSRLNKKEILRNKVFGSVLIGDDITSIKNELLSFANDNMMIIGGSVVKDSDISNFLICFDELIKNTSNLRISNDIPNQHDELKSFSEFDSQEPLPNDEYTPDDTTDVRDDDNKEVHTEEESEFDLTQPDLYKKIGESELKSFEDFLKS